MLDTRLAQAVLKVGDGRGSIVDGPRGKVVISSAHCLPHLPPAHAASYTKERTYARLLGPLGTKPTVWAECFFVDPVADIAVLGSPDDQALYEEARAFDALVDERPAFSIDLGFARENIVRAWLLTITGRWSECEVRHFALGLTITNAVNGIHAGMSGSPIVTDDGKAIGVVSVSSGGRGELHTSGGPNPRLAAHLPGWLLAATVNHVAKQKDGSAAPYFFPR
jgi:hypothetical protein